MNKLILIAFVLILTGCKESYVSPVPPVDTGYLVLEGVIDVEGVYTSIRLSRTTALDEQVITRERGALVRLEDSNNSTLHLLETSEGNYTAGNLHLDTSLKYRIAITTANQEVYLSDFVSVRNNPPIDSISWVRENEGVQLYINTHDPQDNTRYYQWEYNETWQFNSQLSSNLKYVKVNNENTSVTYRDANDPQIYYCWQSNPSTSIILGSSAKLSNDIIHLPLVDIPNASWKLSVLYSILVKQYSWTREGYEFLEKMKKNTELVGSVFDAQPSELVGNIHCVSNPAQPVIGFFNICPVREKRIFISNQEVPGWGYSMPCDVGSDRKPAGQHS
jgi:hypothetical protein